MFLLLLIKRSYFGFFLFTFISLDILSIEE